MFVTELTEKELEQCSGGLSPTVNPGDYWLHRWPIFPPSIEPIKAPLPIGPGDPIIWY